MIPSLKKGLVTGSATPVQSLCFVYQLINIISDGSKSIVFQNAIDLPHDPLIMSNTVRDNKIGNLAAGQAKPGQLCVTT